MSAFAIIGAGNAGCAFAAHLKLLGHETRLFDVIPEQLKGIQDGGNTLRLEGNLPVQGEAKIDLVTDDIAAAIEGEAEAVDVDGLIKALVASVPPPAQAAA